MVYFKIMELKKTKGKVLGHVIFILFWYAKTLWPSVTVVSQWTWSSLLKKMEIFPILYQAIICPNPNLLSMGPSETHHNANLKFTLFHSDAMTIFSAKYCPFCLDHEALDNRGQQKILYKYDVGTHHVVRLLCSLISLDENRLCWTMH